MAAGAGTASVDVKDGQGSYQSFRVRMDTGAHSCMLSAWPCSQIFLQPCYTALMTCLSAATQQPHLCSTMLDPGAERARELPGSSNFLIPLAVPASNIRGFSPNGLRARPPALFAFAQLPRPHYTYRSAT